MTTTLEYARVIVRIAEQLFDNAVAHRARPGDYARLPDHMRFGYELDARTLIDTIIDVRDDEGQPILVWRTGEPMR